MLSTKPTAVPAGTLSVPSGFVPVSVATLQATNVVDCDLYLHEEASEDPVLFRGRDYKATVEDYQTLVARGVKTLYVTTDDYDGYAHRLRENLDALLQQDALEPERRFGILQTAVAAEIERAFNLVKTDNAVQLSQDIGRRITGLLRGSETLPIDLFRMARHDFHTFNHLTNVASYAMLLGERLGIHDEDELSSITVGALLHDIGKRHVPKQILNKPGRLTDEEMKVVQAHPRIGFIELHHREDISAGQLMMVYQHHEKLDGSGYPVGITAEEIHPWAKLCAVVDVFDALTGDRPYRRALGVDDALDYMLSCTGIQFDAEMVHCWVASVRGT